MLSAHFKITVSTGTSTVPQSHTHKHTYTLVDRSSHFKTWVFLQCDKRGDNFYKILVTLALIFKLVFLGFDVVKLCSSLMIICQLHTRVALLNITVGLRKMKQNQSIWVATRWFVLMLLIQNRYLLLFEF